MTLKEVLATVDVTKAQIVTWKRRTSLAAVVGMELTGNTPLPSSIAVSISDPILLVATLVALDGKVQNLVLISPDTQRSEVLRRLSSLGEYVFVSDDVQRSQAIEPDQLFKRYESKESNQTAWVLCTSGTTSIPKQVAHSFNSLARTIKVGEGGEYIWGELYDPYRFAGLQVLLQALLGGSSIIFPDLASPLEKQIELFAQENVNALSATPSLWRKLLMSSNCSSLNLRSITLGGEIADDHILHALSAAFSHAKVRHIYASTEAGAGFSVADGRAGFPVSYLDGTPNGIKLRIERQTLLIHNPFVNGAYVGECDKFVDSDGFVDTGDTVRVDGDRVLFLGRASGVINVGGNKVYPEYVESVLRTLPDINLVRVYGIKSSIVGQLVAADIVANGTCNIEVTKHSLMRVAEEKLKKHERPFSYQFVEAIEHTSTGKFLRQ